MFRYIIKRTLIILPTIWIISVVAFLLSKAVPQDPTISILNNRGISESTNKEYRSVYTELKLNLPNFYFAISPHYYPDNINAISDRIIRTEVNEALKNKYHWQDISKILESRDYKIGHLSQMLREQHKSVGIYFPKWIWHGTDNQYHNWLFSFFDSASLIDGKSSLSKVGTALQWTLSITLLDLVLSIFLSFLLGYYFVKNENSRFLKFLNQGLYLFYSIPIFWLATLLVVYLTTDDYGSWTNIFPSVGIDIYPDKSTMYHIMHNINKLLLPILCLTITSLAYSTRFIRRSLADEMQKPYIQTAYAKGIDRETIIKKHALRNALMPMITIIVSAMANAFAGSLLLEVIFNIPGIGRLLFNSIGHTDWNVVFSIVMVIALVTTVIYLIGDIFYAIANPKIRYDA